MKNVGSPLRTCSSILSLVLLGVTQTGYGAGEVSVVLPFKKTAAVKIEHTVEWVSACQAEYASQLQSQYPSTWLSVYNNRKDKYCTEYLYTFGATVRNTSADTVLDITGHAVATDSAVLITQPTARFGDLPAQTEFFIRDGFKLRANGLLQLAALPVKMSLTFRTDNPLNAPDFPVNTWVEVASLPTPGWTRQSHSSMVVNSRSGSLLVFGSDTHGRLDNAVREFDTQRLRWTTHRPPTTLDTYQVDAQGQAISGTRDNPQPWAMHTYDEVVYDPTVGQLVVTAIDPHNYPAYDKVPNATYHPTWLYDLANHSWRTFVNYGNSDPLRVPNFFARAAEYDEKRDVIWAVRSKELWFIDRNRAAWIKVPAAAPAVQAHVNMVRDSKRDELIVFGQYSLLSSDIFVYKPPLNPAANGTWQVRRPGGYVVAPDAQIPAAYDDEQGVVLLLPSSHTTTLPTDTVVYDPASNVYAKVPGTSPIQGAHVNPLNFMLQYHPARKMFVLVTGWNKVPVTVTVWAFKLDYGRLMSP